jgi:RNA polymerase sigma factor (sigma-70 family)
VSTTEPDPAVIRERRHLLNVAYRLLGSLAEAEDAVQETYARWYAMPRHKREEVESLGAWLTTVTSRICLDMLGSARARRERYVGEWIPEPIPGPAAENAGDPADRVTLDESVTMAFLVVLESMTPAERVAFVLHDVFRYPFADVAGIVGRTEAACRQLASSARRRVRDSETPTAGDATRNTAVVREFKRAWEARDIGALVGLLDPAVTATGDGGGLASAQLRPIVGGAAVARAFVDVAGKAPGMTVLERPVNGQPGLIAQVDGVTVTVMAFDIAGNRIRHIWAVRNPEKLGPWRAT